MKLKIEIVWLLFVLILLPTTAFAFQVTVDASDVSTNLNVTVVGNIPNGGTVTHDLAVGSYQIYSYSGGQVASFNVEASGTVSYDPAYEGGVLTGAGTATLTVVGHEIVFDGSNVDTNLIVDGTIYYTNHGEILTLKLPANVERRDYDKFEISSYSGGKIAYFQVEDNGTVSYDPAYEGGVLTGAGTATLTVVGHEIVFDGSNVDTNLIVDGTIYYTNHGEILTLKLPANVERRDYDKFEISSYSGGKIAYFQVEDNGTVSYDPAYEGGVLTGAGTATLTVVGHEIVFDGSNVDTNLIVDGTIYYTNHGEILTLKLPANVERRDYDKFEISSYSGGKIAYFQVEDNGTVSYDPAYEGGVLTGAGTATLTVVGHEIVFDGSNVDTNLIVDGTIYYTNHGEILTLKLPANVERRDYDKFTIRSSPGGIIASLNVEASGTVSYDPAYEGEVLTGAGTSTLSIIGKPVTIDATDVTADYVWLPYLPSTVSGGSTGLFFLPANNPEAPYKLYSQPGGYVPDGQFTIHIDGSCTLSEVTYEYGTILLYCETYNPDSEPPLTSDVVANPNPVEVNNDVTLTATIDDNETGGSDIASAEYSIDGGDWVQMVGTFDSPTVEVSATIPFATFPTPEVHQICVRGSDDASNIGLTECIFLAVYDPEGGFVTGGGWINSPEGAYAADPTLTGKANFGFVSKYKKGATIPTGNTEFQFKAGDLNFHSSSYDWLVVTGSDYAKFKGSGTISGMGDYKFKIWAGDGDPDTFRIKIWEEDEFGVETDIYDNGFDQLIGGGSIKVHTK